VAEEIVVTKVLGSIRGGKKIRRINLGQYQCPGASTQLSRLPSIKNWLE